MPHLVSGFTNLLGFECWFWFLISWFWCFVRGAALNIFSRSVKFLLGFMVGLVWLVGLVSIVGSGFSGFLWFGLLFLDEVAKPLCFTNIISLSIFKNIFWFLWG